MKTLLVAAYQAELDAVARRLPDAIAAGRVALRAVGVGVVDAAAGTVRALAAEAPDRVVLVGVAARMPSAALGPGDVVVVRRAHLVLREPEYAPAAMATRADADPDLAGGFARGLGLPLVESVGSLGVTFSDGEAARLAGGPAVVESLEAFGVLQAAARRVPATCVLGVAGRIGDHAAAEWRAHHAAAENAAYAALARALNPERSS